MFGKLNSILFLVIYVLFSLSNREMIFKENNFVIEDLILIDKINLSVPLSENNTLDKGLEIHEISQKENMPLVVMGHSGIGQNAYFNDLDKLSIFDEITIYKNNFKISYIIEEIYNHRKGEKLKIINDSQGLYLITCDKFDMKKQLIIYAKVAKLSKIAAFLLFFKNKKRKLIPFA